MIASFLVCGTILALIVWFLCALLKKQDRTWNRKIFFFNYITAVISFLLAIMFVFVRIELHPSVERAIERSFYIPLVWNSFLIVLSSIMQGKNSTKKTVRGIQVSSIIGGLLTFILLVGTSLAKISIHIDYQICFIFGLFFIVCFGILFFIAKNKHKCLKDPEITIVQNKNFIPTHSQSQTSYPPQAFGVSEKDFQEILIELNQVNMPANFGNSSTHITPYSTKYNKTNYTFDNPFSEHHLPKEMQRDVQYVDTMFDSEMKQWIQEQQTMLSRQYKTKDKFSEVEEDFISHKTFMNRWIIDSQYQRGLKYNDFSGCYLILIFDDEVIDNDYSCYREVYVGQSKRVHARVHSHFRGKGNGDVYCDVRNKRFVYVRFYKCEENKMNDLEKQLITLYDATKSYNKTHGGSGLK